MKIVAGIWRISLPVGDCWIMEFGCFLAKKTLSRGFTQLSFIKVFKQNSGSELLEVCLIVSSSETRAKSLLKSQSMVGSSKCLAEYWLEARSTFSSSK